MIYVSASVGNGPEVSLVEAETIDDACELVRRWVDNERIPGYGEGVVVFHIKVLPSEQWDKDDEGWIRPRRPR